MCFLNILLLNLVSTFSVVLASSILYIFTNCLAYRYRYQSFIIGCWYFLKKCKLPVWTKTLLFVAGIFLVIFLFPSDIVVICLCLSYLSSDNGLIVFYFSFCGALGLLSCLKSKKHKAGFPTGVEDMGRGALQNLMGRGGGLNQYMGEAWGA